MIDVARIDHWATSGTGPLHRATVTGKVLFFAMIVAASVLSRSPFPLASGCLALFAVAALAGLPWLRLAGLALSAAFFAMLYALALRASAAGTAMMVLKAVVPAYAAGMLVVTTPYPRIFAFLDALLPEILAAGLFITYRTLFILLEMMKNFGAAIRLRGGSSPGRFLRNASNIAGGIAMLVLRAVERSSRLYAVMSVRGYGGSMAARESVGLRSTDWLPLLSGAGVLAGVLVQV